METSWKTVTANLYKGVKIQVLCNIAVAVFGAFAALGNAADLAEGFAKGELSLGWGIWDYLEFAASIGAIYGFWIFFSNLKPWQALLTGNDSKAVGRIHTATILQIVAIVLAFIPLIGIIGGILNLVAWVLLLMAYSDLKNSSTFPASEGAGKIFTAMILNLVAAIIGWIPVIGLIGTILSIVAFIKTLNGWKLIADSNQA